MSKSTPEVSRDFLVQRVNELFHDALNQDYQSTFEDIQATESERWVRCANQMLVRPEPLGIIEIGTGTGFVPLTVAAPLKAVDTWFCSDISQGVLDLARQKLASSAFACRFEFCKLSTGLPYRLPWPDQFADVVLMNSVLHHLENTSHFLAEVDRLIKPRGLLIIAHEPNLRFFRNRYLRANYRILDFIFNLRPKLASLGRHTGTLGIMQHVYYWFHPARRNQMGRRGERMRQVFKQVNSALLQENLINRPLRDEQIQQLVDIHAETGFDPFSLIPGYRIESLETYNHLLTVSSAYAHNYLIRKLDAGLARRWPHDGAIFFAVYRKP